MQISVGDKVSFINEKLDGTVHSIINSRLVKVEIDDGFIIDADVKQLVIVQKFINAKTETQDVDFEKPVAKKISSALSFTMAANTIQFITAPAEENKILSGNINFYVCNNTSSKILFALYAFAEKRAQLIDSGEIQKQNEKLIANKSRSDIFDWNHFTIQILFCDEHNFNRPVVKDIPVLLPDLNAVSKNENVLQSFAKYFEVADLTTPEEIPVELLKEKLETRLQQKENFTSPLSALKQKKNIPDRGDILLNTKEVDLHIEELTDDFSHLTNAEIIALQLKHFTKELNYAISNHFYSIVFIHGVGNGKLKQELRNELKNYPVTFRDGEYLKYGNGATEVILK
jgi:hypothetical protein